MVQSPLKIHLLKKKILFFVRLCESIVKYNVKHFPMMYVKEGIELLKYFTTRFFKYFLHRFEKKSTPSAYQQLKSVEKYISTTPTLIRLNLNRIINSDIECILKLKNTLFCGVNLFAQPQIAFQIDEDLSKNPKQTESFLKRAQELIRIITNGKVNLEVFSYLYNGTIIPLRHVLWCTTTKDKM